MLTFQALAWSTKANSNMRYFFVSLIKAVAILAVGYFAINACVWVYLSWPTGLPQTVGKVSTASSNTHIVKTALETYYLDNQVLPAAADIRFLTTPVAYLTNLQVDPFSNNEEPMQIRTSGSIFMIFSVGPDRLVNLRMPEDTVSSETLIITKIYDASNGTWSSGDIVRVGEFTN